MLPRLFWVPIAMTSARSESAIPAERANLLNTVGRDWLVPYEPLPWLRGGHAQTLAGNYWRRRAFDIPSEAVAVEVDASDGSRVRCDCHWQPQEVRGERLTILLVHGLEGSSDSQYIRGITGRAWAAGCNVIRMNMRNCGGTDTWTPTLYHSGLSGDVHAVLQHFAALHGLRRVAMAGYSMGGNLVMKLAGELGQGAPEWLVAAVGVSPAADLAACADALHEPANRVYEAHFLRGLMRRFRRKVELFPERYSIANIGRVRSVREFDDKITAPFSGFADADDYYARSSAARVAERIAIPTLVIHALDDPFIRMMLKTREALLENASVALVETEHGGHCAFLAQVSRNSAHGHHSGEMKPERHWAEATLVRFLLAAGGQLGGG
jgi:predicted alpha/beta-fold hydrolase